MKEVIRTYQEKVDTRLRLRQGAFIIIISVLTVINIVNITKGKIEVLLASSGFLIAVIVGFAFTRVFKISWHTEKAKVIARLDRFGIILFALYFIVELSRKWFFEYWLSGATLNAFSLVLLSGILFGRFLGTFRRINQVLSENDKA